MTRGGINSFERCFAFPRQRRASGNPLTYDFSLMLVKLTLALGRHFAGLNTLEKQAFLDVAGDHRWTLSPPLKIVARLRKSRPASSVLSP